MYSVEGRKFSVLGLARTGVAAANWLARNGAEVLASDPKSKEELPIGELDPRVRVHCGANIVREGDVVVISPGIKPGTEAFNLAHERGCEVISDIELFGRLCSCPIVAVTGTDGKSTTTALIGVLLDAAGYHTFIGGNIGRACMEGLNTLGKGSVAVLEVSCFQLIHCPTFCPDVAVITNIAEDHIEYHGSMDAYIAAKKQVYKNMSPAGRLVLNGDDPEVSRWTVRNGMEVLRFGWKPSFDVFADDHFVYVFGKRIIEQRDLKLPGLHNIENIMAALAAVHGRFLDASVVANAVRNFPGLEHRMEFVETVNGVSFYNDSKATNPHAAMAVVKSFREPFWLLAGGYEKGSDFSQLGRLIAQRTRGVILYGATRHRLRESIPDGPLVKVVETLDEAVQAAFDAAAPGDKIVLAPACASFDQFTDYEARGRTFKDIVRKLKQAQEERK